jgi:hypothetical protein
MAKKLFIDQDDGLFVESIVDSSKLSPPTWANKDNLTLEFYFLRQTGIFGRPFSYENKSTATISVGLGLLTTIAVATATTFSNLPTTVTPTVTVITAGSSTTSEVQKISFSPKAGGGVWAITVPADGRSITSAVTAGVFITTANNGFIIGQPIVFATITPATGFTMGTTYYVYDLQSPDRFRIASTSGGTVMSTITASAGSGTVSTSARTTAVLQAYADASTVQTELRRLDCVGSAGVEVVGEAGNYFYISATGTRQNADFPLMTVTNSLEPPYGRTGNFSLSVAGLQTLLDAETDDTVELVLEVEVNDTGGIKETYSTKVTVVEDLI